MKAIICNTLTGIDDLSLEEVESPAVKAGEIRIATHACGVNFLDTLIVAGKYQEKPPLPFVPGAEVAGEIIEVGEGVKNVKVGDRVVAIASTGGYAEETVVNAVTAIPLPPQMDYVQAAAFPLAYGTSHVALDHRGKLKSGETLLVLGAAGGVGLTAVEIGKLMGATVIAAASTPEKLALTQAKGADHVINYSEENLRDRIKEITGGKGVDVVYDPVGGDLFQQALRSLNWEGRMLVIGFASGSIPEVPVSLTLVKNVSIVGVYWGAYALRDPAVLGGSLMQLFAWFSEGKLAPHVSATYPLAQTQDAIRSLANREATGKVVVETRK
ncbi:MAG: NADPH:quinone oxidoreductase family protein [Aggregatilineales bacterium]